MNNLVSRWFILALFACVPLSPNHTLAADGIAAAVPTEVPQVLTGGYWKKDAQSGTYRALVISNGLKENSTVDVYVQWLAIPENADKPDIVKTVRVKEITGEKIKNAFVFMQGDTEGEITFIVSSYDPVKDEELQFWLKASSPGKYKMIPPEQPKQQPPAKTQ